MYVFEGIRPAPARVNLPPLPSSRPPTLIAVAQPQATSSHAMRFPSSDLSDLSDLSNLSDLSELSELSDLSLHKQKSYSTLITQKYVIFEADNANVSHLGRPKINHLRR